MNIKINSHSSIQIDDNIYFDPFNTTSGMPVARIIFITHPHYDHFSPTDINRVADKNTIIVTTKDNTEAEMMPHSKIIYSMRSRSTIIAVANEIRNAETVAFVSLGFDSLEPTVA